MTARKTSARADSSITVNSIAQLFEGIAAVFLRLGVDSPKAEGLLRRAFVFAAVQKLRTGEQRPTQSKFASLAGLSRLEVRTILGNRNSQKLRRWTRIDQIITGWKSDPLFLDSRGKPKPLNPRGSKKSFERLVKKYGRDVTARTLRDELIRRGIVVQRHKRLVLLTQTGTISPDLLAAQSDLKFLVSHLSGIDFRSGRRAYVTRQSALVSADKKGGEMLKRIALNRLETVLSSLADMSVDARSLKPSERHRARRLRVTAIVATEAEDK